MNIWTKTFGFKLVFVRCILCAFAYLLSHICIIISVVHFILYIHGENACYSVEQLYLHVYEVITGNPKVGTRFRWWKEDPMKVLDQSDEKRKCQKNQVGIWIQIHTWRVWELLEFGFNQFPKWGFSHFWAWIPES